MLNLRSKVAVKILDYYFAHPEKSYYVNELAGLLALDPKNTHRKLEEFEASGILKSEFRGKQRYFSLNSGSVLLKEYKNIFLQTQGWEKQLAQDLKALNGLQQAYIFGSAASGKMGEQSDIDLLLVGSHSVLAAGRLISRLQKKLGREINAVQMSPQELSAKKHAKNDFIMNIFKHKTIKLV